MSHYVLLDKRGNPDGEEALIRECTDMSEAEASHYNRTGFEAQDYFNADSYESAMIHLDTYKSNGGNCIKKKKKERVH